MCWRNSGTTLMPLVEWVKGNYCGRQSGFMNFEEIEEETSKLMGEIAGSAFAQSGKAMTTGLHIFKGGRQSLEELHDHSKPNVVGCEKFKVLFGRGRMKGSKRMGIV